MKIFGTLALVALGLAAASAPASAAVICNGCDIGGNLVEYLGVHNPNTSDQSTYVHNDIAPGALSDIWVFDIAPAGTVNITATFNPVAAISNFSVAMVQVLVPGNCSIANQECTTPPTLGPVIASNTPGTNNLSLQNLALAAGRYAFRITGTVTNGLGTESYSGNLTTFAVVPEPATLSLLGLGLLVVARRRRSA